MKKLLITTGMLASFILTGCGSATPKEVAQDYINAFTKGDGNTIEKITTEKFRYRLVDSYCSEDEAKKDYPKCFSEYYNKRLKKKLSVLKKFEITGEEKVDDTHEKVLVKVYLKDGSTDSDKIKLVKVDGEWKVGR